MPDVRVVNWLVEQSVSNRWTGVDHVQRPGMVLLSDLGPDPVRGVFRQAGTFNGDFLAASGTTLYRVTQGGTATALGTLTGDDRFTAAATSSRAIVVANDLAVSTTGGALTPVVMPDSRPAGSVAQLNGYFIIPQSDSARFYWIEPGQTDPDGLGFATTESSPGNILKVERVGDELWFFKQEGIEVWTPTGDVDLPFQRVAGRNYDKGARATDSICRFDNSVAWVGNDGVVYRGDASPVRFSDNALEEQIRKSLVEDLTAWSFSIDGHALWCLTLSEGTYAYDAASQQWSELKSYNRDYWRAHVGDVGDTFVVCGDRETGVLYRLDPEAANDAGEPLERVLRGGVPVQGEPVRCDSFDLYLTTGTAEDPNLYPKARLSWSDDLETFGDFEDVSIGRQGKYNEPVRLNRLGAMRYPGRLWEVRITDDVRVTISAAFYNERSR
jgi:hypothetical protein